jgi:hypothetical protein
MQRVVRLTGQTPWCHYGAPPERPRSRPDEGALIPTEPIGSIPRPQELIDGQRPRPSAGPGRLEVR